MFRALLWKEWRQLSLIRWGGIALGAVLPAAFVAGAELSQRGLLPTGAVKGYAPRDLMFELLPAALAFGLWPLIALISVVQALTGDRVAGTEAFLLERPVPRGATWRARLATAFFSMIVVIAGTGSIAAGAAALTGAPPTIGWSRFTLLTVGGIGLALLAYLGGAIAASLVPSQLAALLLGALFGAGPVLAAAMLAALFFYARIGDVFLGILVPVVVLPAFIVASWLAFCGGEPAGRGRVRRALTLVGAALAASLVVFVVAAPVAVRASARSGQHAVSPAPSGQRALVGAWGRMEGGWLIDVASGARLRFIPPPVSELAWRPDGSEFAVLTWSGPLGSYRSNERIDIRSADDGSLLRSFPFDDGTLSYGMVWAEGGLVVVGGEEGSTTQAVEVIDPNQGTRRSTGFSSQRWPMALSGPIEDGRVFVRRAKFVKLSDDRPIPRGYQLLPVDVTAAKVGSPMTDASGAELALSGWPLGLSRSGRFARIVDLDDEAAKPRVVDLRGDAAPVPALGTSRARWLAGDRLVWFEALGDRSRMLLASPGAEPIALREWQVASIGFEPSPDGRAVFVTVIKGQAGYVDPEGVQGDPAHFVSIVPVGIAPEEVVYLADESRFVSLSPPFSDRASDQKYTQWAGEKTLARFSLGSVALEDIDAPGKRRTVFGGLK